MKKRRYAVLGAGRQGEAAAYDLAVFGNAGEVLIADRDQLIAEKAARRLNALLGETIAHPLWLDATDGKVVQKALRGIDGLVSAMHYNLNLGLTKVAIYAGWNMVDLGGNTSVVIKQHELNSLADLAGVRIIPDCGMAPGFNVNLACYALGKMADPKHLIIYCGGIPEHPKLPLGYHFPFSVAGLVNECSGFADVIQDGEVRQQSCLFSLEKVTIPEIGKLEATHTSGGLSTSPWTLEKNFPKLETLEYKTLRYPGHWKILQKLARENKLESGLLRLEKKTPRDPEDLGIIQVNCSGFDEHGHPKRVIVEVIDRYDAKTRFTAMQRLTGFHASIMLIAATETMTDSGVLSVESIDPQMIVREFAKRGIAVNETCATKE